MSASISLPSAKRAAAPRSVGFDGDAALAEPDVGRLQRAAQHVEQVGAVHGEVGRAEFLAEIAAAHARDVAPALPGADDQKFRSPADGFDLVLEAERAERLDRVGREIEAGADLAVHRRLLADDDLGAAALQRQRRGKPADAAADNGDARARGIGFLPAIAGALYLHLAMAGRARGHPASLVLPLQRGLSIAVRLRRQ